MHLLARCIHCTKFKKFPVTLVKKRRANNIFSKTSSLTLHLWPCNLKINRVIYSLGASTVQSLTTSKQRGQKIYLFKTSSSNLTFDPDFKVNRGHLHPRGINCTSFGNFQAKGSRDIEWTKFFPRPMIWPWSLTMWPQNQLGSSTPLGHPMYQVWQLSSKGV